MIDIELAEELRRLRACLAEMGWTDPGLVLSINGRAHIMQQLPAAVAYMAFRTTDPDRVCCWSCWDAVNYSMWGDNFKRARACRDGNCTRPNEPKLPPRELITQPRGYQCP